MANPFIEFIEQLKQEFPLPWKFQIDWDEIEVGGEALPKRHIMVTYENEKVFTIFGGSVLVYTIEALEIVDGDDWRGVFEKCVQISKELPKR